MSYPQPTIVPVPRLNQYRLESHFKYTLTRHSEAGRPPDGYAHLEYLGRILVEEGFTYDGASIPGAAQGFTYTPFHPDVMAPSLVHDFHYRGFGTVSRELADYIFLEMLIHNGVSWMRAASMHWAVREFGGLWWGGETELEPAFVGLEALQMASEHNDQ